MRSTGIMEFIWIIQNLVPASQVRDMRWRRWLWHCATNWEVAGSITDEVIGFFDWPKPYSRSMALGPIQPLTLISTRNLPESKGLPMRKTDNLTAIWGPIVHKMWKPRRLKTIWASIASCKGNSLPQGLASSDCRGRRWRLSCRST
jgi:hypothetical protein